MRRRVGIVISCGLVWMGAAISCAGPRAPEAVPAAVAATPATPAATPPSAPDLAYHMRVSFWDALDAREALILGDLSGAKQAAERLARTDYAHALPPAWMPWVMKLQQEANELTLAGDLHSASLSLARIALVCGECHELRDAGPTQPRAKPMPWEDPPESFDARMERHQLGMQQMWDGLVLPSEQAFRSGTVTITRAPLRAPERAEASVESSLHARIEEIRALAKDARRATSYEERGRVYGELLSRCADCHYKGRPM